VKTIKEREKASCRTLTKIYKATDTAGLDIDGEKHRQLRVSD
jgi:hypothetical protein